MICRRCGNRIPEHLTTRESFQCPACGRQFGAPSENRAPRADYAPRAVRESRVSREPVRPQRRAPEYDNRRQDDRSYASRRNNAYYEEPVYEEPYYDEPDSEEPYYEESYYEEPYYDAPAYDDGPDMRREPRTMKLVTLLYVFIAAVITLIIVACVAAGLNGNPDEEAAKATAQPAQISTEQPTAAATQQPAGTESPYPVV